MTELERFRIALLKAHAEADRKLINSLAIMGAGIVVIAIVVFAALLTTRI